MYLLKARDIVREKRKGVFTQITLGSHATMNELKKGDENRPIFYYEVRLGRGDKDVSIELICEAMFDFLQVVPSKPAAVSGNKNLVDVVKDYCNI